MSKKMLLAAAVLALASCAAEKEAPFFRYCPNVQLVPEFSRMTQMAGKQEEGKNRTDRLRRLLPYRSAQSDQSGGGADF